MTNEVIQDAEESRAIEKTAIEQSESTPATAEAIAPETTVAVATASETPAAEAAPAQEADHTPEILAVELAPAASEIAAQPAPAPVETAPAIYIPASPV